MSSSALRIKDVQRAQTFKVGDIIKAYHSGYHRITKIEKRFIGKNDTYWDDFPTCIGMEYSPLFYYERVLNEELEEPTRARKFNSCDASHCFLITRNMVDSMMVKAIAGLTRLKDLL